MHDHATALFARAANLHQSGQLDAAEALYRSVLDQCGPCAEVLHHLGLVKFHQHDFATACTLLQQAIALEPSALIYNHLGVVLKSSQQWAAAQSAYEQALHLEPHNPSVWSNLGNVQQEQGQLAAALHSLQTALSYDPQLFEARVNLALVGACTLCTVAN